MTIPALSDGMARQGGNPRLSRQNKRLVALRVGAEICATIAFLTALKHMPLANVTAILQALPLAVTMAALFLQSRWDGDAGLRSSSASWAC